jgi:hypothetical protein
VVVEGDVLLACLLASIACRYRCEEETVMLTIMTMMVMVVVEGNVLLEGVG